MSEQPGREGYLNLVHMVDKGHGSLVVEIQENDTQDRKQSW